MLHKILDLGNKEILDRDLPTIYMRANVRVGQDYLNVFYINIRDLVLEKYSGDVILNIIRDMIRNNQILKSQVNSIAIDLREISIRSEIKNDPIQAKCENLINRFLYVASISVDFPHFFIFDYEIKNIKEKIKALNSSARHFNTIEAYYENQIDETESEILDLAS